MADTKRIVKKMGRPPMPAKKKMGFIYGVRLASTEAKLVNDAIKRSGMSQPDWLRRVLLDGAHAQR